MTSIALTSWKIALLWEPGAKQVLCPPKATTNEIPLVLRPVIPHSTRYSILTLSHALDERRVRAKQNFQRANHVQDSFRHSKIRDRQCQRRKGGQETFDYHTKTKSQDSFERLSTSSGPVRYSTSPRGWLSAC